MALKCALIQLSQGYKKTDMERLEESSLKVTEQEKEFAVKAALYQQEIRHLQWLLQDRHETLDRVLQQKSLQVLEGYHLLLVPTANLENSPDC
ncbi:UNVERIFIED_CONTAM: hypothetical protein K2H54_037492 [Gekko kuhli]